MEIAWELRGDWVGIAWVLRGNCVEIAMEWLSFLLAANFGWRDTKAREATRRQFRASIRAAPLVVPTPRIPSLPFANNHWRCERLKLDFEPPTDRLFVGKRYFTHGGGTATAAAAAHGTEVGRNQTVTDT